MSALKDYPRITPFLWFDNNAEEAVDFYLSVFAHSRLIEVQQSAPGASLPAKVLTIAFELDGQQFTALNGGPLFPFTEGISFVVRCDSQQEVDSYWEKLLAGGGREGRCGWLKDRFGVSWQIVPDRLPDLIRNPAALQAMMGMKKLVIAELESAAQQ